MKKIILTIMMIMVTLPTIVFAREDSYYTNLNGAKLTKEQYDRLVDVFGENTVATMTVSAIDILKNETEFDTMEENIYVKIDNYYDFMGRLQKTIETEVSQAEWEDFETNENDGISLYSWNANHTTNMKKITMQVTCPKSTDVKNVTITNEWLSLPLVRSYDVIALMPKTKAGITTSRSETISGYQYWDGNIISYNYNDDNTKVVSSLFGGSGGVGISMNLVDAANTKIINSLTVMFNSGEEYFEIYGTYQHSVEDLTLKQSQSYSFSENGLGKVLYYKDYDIRNSYDNTKGLYLNYRSAEEVLG